MGITYQILKKLENREDFITMLSKGIIPMSIMEKKVYYEKFKSELDRTGQKTQSICNAAEEYKVSEMTIRRAINFMEK